MFWKGKDFLLGLFLGIYSPSRLFLDLKQNKGYRIHCYILKKFNKRCPHEQWFIYQKLKERKLNMDIHDLKLCYVDNGRAFFSTKPPNENWGDDWDDIPYEYNAGDPYEPCWHRNRKTDSPCSCPSCQSDYNEDGTPKWQIVMVYFEADFIEPKDYHNNSPYSVESIIRDNYPWLRPDTYCNHDIKIFPGTELLRFIHLVHTVEGKVFLDLKEENIFNKYYEAINDETTN